MLEETTTSVENKATIVKDKKATKQKVEKITLDPKKRVTSTLVDEIALIDTLEDVRNDLRDQVLAIAKAEGAKYVDGDLASATVSVNNEPTEINAVKFLALCKKKKISQTKLAGAISISKTEAKKLFGEEALAKISDPIDIKAPSVGVKQKDDQAPPQLVEVLQRLEPVVKKFKNKKDGVSPTEQPQPEQTGTPEEPARLQ